MAGAARVGGGVFSWVLIVLAYAALVGLWVGDPAWPWQERVESFHADYVVKPDGSLEVTETIRWHLGRGEHHGIRRDIIVQHPYGPDGESERFYELDDVTAKSPSGAPADVTVSWLGNMKRIQVGDPAVEVDGDQTYVVSYRITQTVNLIEQGADKHVELYWNVTGLETPIRTEQASATVRGPGPVTRTECFQGLNGSRVHCTGTAGKTATFTATDLGPHEGMTLVAAFDPHGFSSTEPDVRERVLERPKDPLVSDLAFQRIFTVWGWTGVALPLLAALAVGTIAWRAGRDEHYAGLVPGMTPTNEDAPIRRGKAAGATSVQFQPPKDLRPGLASVLLQEKVDGQALSATLIDLTVRGHLSIAEIGDGIDWKMTRTTAPSNDVPLRPYEKRLLDEIFSFKKTAVLSHLSQRHPPVLRPVGQSIRSEVRKLGWFRHGPDRDSRWQKPGMVLCVIGIVLMLVGGGGADLEATAGMHRGILTGIAVGLGCFLSGLIIFRLSGTLKARTAAGSALLAQVQGFRRYLETAEADQIRFEEAENIFSRYLPYAMVFGVAEHWVAVLKQVMDKAAAEGVPISAPAWYGAAGVNNDHGVDRMLEGVNSFSNSATATIETPPVGSSSSSGSSGGGSGFSSSSSSGGSSGGGGGGGGSSSW